MVFGQPELGASSQEMWLIRLSFGSELRRRQFAAARPHQTSFEYE